MLLKRARSRPFRIGMVTFALLASIVAGFASTSPARAESQPRGDDPIHQLRIYEIFENNKAAFHARFHDHAVRIMRKYNINIVAM